jgi:CRP-like cAMP-binding protein
LLSYFHAALPPAGEPREDFGLWLFHQLGVQAQPELSAAYFERKQFEGGETIYRQGEAANTIDFIASGSVAVILDDGRRPPRRVRRSAQQTVLGEMGFFRALPRAATIAAEGPVLIFTLSRANLARLQSEHPAIYEAFLQFVIRALSDRLELAHKEIAALT